MSVSRLSLLRGVCAGLLGLGCLSFAPLAHADGGHGQHHGHHNDGNRSRFDFDLSLGNQGSPFFDPGFGFDNPNDRWGYRAFIPNGGGGQIFYSDTSRSTPWLGSGSGHHRGHYDNFNSNCYDNYNSGFYGARPYRIIHYGEPNYQDSLSLSYNDGTTSFSYGRGRPIYSAPSCGDYGYYRGDTSYVYPGGGGLVIDGSGRYFNDGGLRESADYSLPPQGDVYNDNRVYNTYNYYGDNAPGAADAGTQAPAAPAAAPAQPQYLPQGPPAPPASSAPAAQPQQGTYGTRFYDETRLASSDGGWHLWFDGDKLRASQDSGKGQVVASGANAGFGCYALWQAGEGLTLIYRSGESVYAAYRQPSGEWWSEPLPYSVDYSHGSSLGLVGGELWYTFSATDGLRYVVALKQHAWTELGSASGVR